MRSDDPTRIPWRPLEISLLAGSVLLITLSAFEGLATTTIMPNVVADLRAESWFSLASGAALAAQLSATVVAGSLSDSLGPRAVLGWGLAFFTIGLLVCGLAPLIEIFVLGRLLQGIGGGLIIVPLYVFIGSIADPAHRPAFFAAFSLAWVLPGLIGPAIAGFTATAVGWRPVFLAVPALALLALIPLVSVLRSLGTSPRRPASALPRLLFLALIAGTGVVALQLSGAVGGVELLVLAALGVGLAGWSLPRLLPTGAFRLDHGVPSAIMTRMLSLGAQSGASALLPLILQRIHHWGADSAALAVTIGTVSWSLGASIQSRIRSPGSRMRLPLIGVALLVLGLIPLLGLVSPAFPVWPALVGWLLAGAGTGLMHSTLSVLALDLTDPAEHGKVASWLQVADAAGSAGELALVSIALAASAGLGAAGPLGYLPAPLIALCFALLALMAALRIAPAQMR